MGGEKPGFLFFKKVSWRRTKLSEERAVFPLAMSTRNAKRSTTADAEDRDAQAVKAAYAVLIAGLESAAGRTAIGAPPIALSPEEFEESADAYTLWAETRMKKIAGDAGISVREVCQILGLTGDDQHYVHNMELERAILKRRVAALYNGYPDLVEPSKDLNVIFCQPTRYHCVFQVALIGTFSELEPRFRKLLNEQNLVQKGKKEPQPDWSGTRE